MTIYGLKRELEIKLHNEFHNLYTSLNIIRVIKSKSMRWAGMMKHAWVRSEM
jgi:hypothetical protein